MTTWRDKQFGKSGRWVWFFPTLAPVITIGMPLVFLYMASLDGGQDLAPTAWFCGAIFVPATLWAFYYIVRLRQIVQQVTLDDGTLTARFYYGRRRSVPLTDIASAGYYVLNWKTRMLNFLDPKNPGIDIVLNTGETLRISHKMKDFDGLAKELQDRVPNASVPARAAEERKPSWARPLFEKINHRDDARRVIRAASLYWLLLAVVGGAFGYAYAKPQESLVGAAILVVLAMVVMKWKSRTAAAFLPIVSLAMTVEMFGPIRALNDSRESTLTILLVMWILMSLWAGLRAAEATFKYRGRFAS